MIKIIKDKDKHRRIQRRITKRIGYFGLFWEAEIYSRTAGKYGRTLMERFTGNTIKISECTEFDFTIYTGIGTIRLIRHKTRLIDGLEHHIRYEVTSINGFKKN